MEAAVAGRPGPLVVAHPRQPVVAPLTGDGVAAGERPSMDDDADADTRAENGGKHDLGPGGGTIGRLGDGKAVGVILQPHGTAKGTREITIQRPTDEPGGVGVLDQPGRRRDGAGNADADRAARANGLLKPGHERGYGGDLAVIVAGRRGGPLAVELAPIGGERDDFELGAAEIDADADRMRHLSLLAAARVPLLAAARVREDSA